ncbi:MAG: copper amine oxidase N-terminal domain-containing protein [Desulfuromonadaceae bacterium]
MKRFSLGLLTGLIAGLILATTTFAIGNPLIHLVVNGIEVSPDVSPVVIDGRTMVPIRTVAEALGAEVQYNSLGPTVFIRQYQQPSQITKSINTVIVEPKFLNKTSAIEMSGPPDFKNQINDALELLKSKSPADYKLVTGFVLKLNVNNSMDPTVIAKLTTDHGIVEVNWEQFKNITNPIPHSTNTIFMAGILTHESYHSYMREKGLLELYTNGLTPTESEILAYLRERQALTKLDAPKFLFDVVSIDKYADNNTSK